MKTPRGVRRNRRRVTTGPIQLVVVNQEVWAIYRIRRSEEYWPVNFQFIRDLRKYA